MARAPVGGPANLLRNLCGIAFLGKLGGRGVWTSRMRLLSSRRALPFRERNLAYRMRSSVSSEYCCSRGLSIFKVGSIAPMPSASASAFAATALVKVRRPVLRHVCQLLHIDFWSCGGVDQRRQRALSLLAVALEEFFAFGGVASCDPLHECGMQRRIIRQVAATCGTAAPDL